MVVWVELTWKNETGPCCYDGGGNYIGSRIPCGLKLLFASDLSRRLGTSTVYGWSEVPFFGGIY